MLLTNLTATENNGVVTAEFEAMGGKVKLQVGLDKVVDHVYKQSETISFRYAKSLVNMHLAAFVTDFINHNLQEAE